MANIPCALVLKECLPCNDDPVANITAEAPDVDVFIGFRDFNWNPPLGNTYFQLGCKAICFSTVSQQEADLCALRQAQACVWNGGKPPVTPPIPPGPNSPGGKGQPPNTPGGVPPGRPRNPVRVFSNRLQTCDATCPDGAPFTEFVAAGTITELSQALADEKARSLACNRAQANLFCISAAAPPSACVGESYFFRLNTSGGVDLLWSVESGVMPPGLNLDPVNGTISGTPITSGNFSFTIAVTDSSGRGQMRTFSICIMEIVTGATLPPGATGDDYSVPLIQEPATIATEVWSLVSGNLPAGITLSPAGALLGNPSNTGIFEFAVRVDAECNGSAVSCQKSFNLEVESGIDCFGLPESITDTTWDVAFPAFGPVVFTTGGDGTFNLQTVGAQSPILSVETDFCNPGTAYDGTIDVEWTVASALPDGTLFTVMQIRINGVTTFFPGSTGPGTFSLNASGSIVPGVNNIRIFGGAGAGTPPITLNGTITVRPLTPP